MAQGKSNSAIAAALFVTERAVEKHTNSIFAKLGLSEEKDVNRRVKAVLLFLSQQAGPVTPGGGWPHPPLGWRHPRLRRGPCEAGR